MSLLKFTIMSKKFYPLIFIVGLVALILFQNKIVMPAVEKIAASSLFLKESGDEGSRFTTSTNMTNFAFIMCNKSIRDEINSDTNITFPSEAIQSWALGNFRYIINAEIEVNTEDEPSLFRKYACQIQYEEETDLEGVMNLDNWSIIGISGISNL